MYSGSYSLKYFKRLKIFKNSTGTVQFNPETKSGWSYNWNFVGMVEGVLVFNEYHWSQTTSCHQTAVSSVLRELGLKAVRGDFGAVDVSSLGRESVVKLYKQLFKLLIEIESSKRPDSRAHGHRVASANEILSNIQKLEAIGPRFRVPQKMQRQLKAEAEQAELDRVSEREGDKCFKFLAMKQAAQNLTEIQL